MGILKEISIESWTYNFFNDMINIRNFDPKSLKTKSRTKISTLIKLDLSQYKII